MNKPSFYSKRDSLYSQPPHYTPQELETARNSLRLFKMKYPTVKTLKAQGYIPSSLQPPVKNSQIPKKLQIGKEKGINLYQKRNRLGQEIVSQNIEKMMGPNLSRKNRKMQDQPQRPQKPDDLPIKPMSNQIYQEEYLQPDIKPKPQNKQKPIQKPVLNKARNQIAQRKNNQVQPLNQKFKNTNQAPPQEFGSVQLFQCREGCGRKFNKKALIVHEKNCAKVFQQKRKVFDSKQQRIEQLPSQGKKKVQKKAIDPQKDLKWKAKSQQFRKAMKMAKGQLNQQQAAQFKRISEQAQGLKECKHCKRKFNQNAIQKHEPACGAKSPSKRNMKKN